MRPAEEGNAVKLRRPALCGTLLTNCDDQVPKPQQYPPKHKFSQIHAWELLLWARERIVWQWWLPQQASTKRDDRGGVLFENVVDRWPRFLDQEPVPVVLTLHTPCSFQSS